MTDSDDDIPVKTHDSAVAELCKSLINVFIKSSQDTHGDTPLEKLKNAAKYDGNEPMWSAITALSTYREAKAAERQASAMESLVKTARTLSMSETADTTAQAIVDQREPKRDYLASTYSLPTETLSLLWAMRGLLIDASIRSLSKPDRFDPYRRLSTEEIAWSLRLSPEQLTAEFPRTPDGSIDYALLEDFDLVHYGGSDDAPDDWLYNG
jgi:hypothetical protein